MFCCDFDIMAGRSIWFSRAESRFGFAAVINGSIGQELAGRAYSSQVLSNLRARAVRVWHQIRGIEV
jgi:hypothetical protein